MAEIAEITYPKNNTIEMLGRIDVEVKLEPIILGHYLDESEYVSVWRKRFKAIFEIYVDFPIKDIEKFAKWINENIQEKYSEIETDARPWAEDEEEWIKCGGKWMIKPKKIAHIPLDSNWKITIERFD